MNKGVVALANVGDVIEFCYDFTTYHARVDAILEDGYGVHVVYDSIGLQQDVIEQSKVVAVYNLHSRVDCNDSVEF